MNVVLKNDLFRFREESDKIYRILWTSSDNKQFFAIDVNASNAWPELFETDFIFESVKTEEIVYGVEDEFAFIHNETDLSAASREKREQLWIDIEPLLIEPDIYDKRKRNYLLKGCTTEHGKCRRTLQRNLRRYWQRGMNKNALLPDYKNSGVAKYSLHTSHAKRGRPRQYDVVQGVNVDEEMKSIFKKSIKRFYHGSSKSTFKDAYDDMIRVYFSDENPNGELVPRISEIPTIEQFRYWYKKDRDLEAELRARKGDKNYEKDHRPILSTSTIEAYGPGAVFQIDSTIGDIYLVSKLDPRKIIGRPVIYEVIDVFSRMVVGLYIGIENASYLTAADALANAMTDKVSFCKLYGVNITSKQWASCHIPDAIIADNAELKGKQIENFIEAFSVRTENTSAYRGDCKGIVERHFRTIQATFKRHLGGTIDKDFRQRGAEDYRLGAALTLDDLTTAFIHCILFHNNAHEISKYDKDFKMMAEDVPAIPVELWNWGIANRSGALRSQSEKVIKAYLLPRASARVTRKGVLFQGCYYHCDRAMEEGWYVRAGQKTWKIEISFDPRNISNIYIPKRGKLSFDICSLTPASRAFENMSLWDLQELKKKVAQGRAKRRGNELAAQVNLDNQLQGIARLSQERRMQSGLDSRSKTERLGNIRENREEEKNMSRAGDAMVLADRKFTGQKAAVIPIAQEDAEEDFSYPNRARREKIIKGREDEK